MGAGAVLWSPCLSFYQEGTIAIKSCGQATLGPYCNSGYMETLSVAVPTWIFFIFSRAGGKQGLGVLDAVRVICC